MHRRTLPGKLGQPFTRTKTPDFCNERVAIFDRIKAEQDAAIAAKEQFAITIHPDGGEPVQGNAWKTLPIDIAKGISKELAKDSIVACVTYTGRRDQYGGSVVDASGMDDEDDGSDDGLGDGELWDLLRPLEGDCHIRFITFEDAEGKEVFWHSSAHILGECLEQEIGSQLTVGPPIELGPKGSFFYDSYMGNETISDGDYKPLEQKAAKVIKAGHDACSGPYSGS